MTCRSGASFLRGRATALGMTLASGALVLVTFALVVLGGVLQAWLGQRFGFSAPLFLFFRIYRWVVIVAALMVAIRIRLLRRPQP